MDNGKYLIVNADDFGRSSGINSGIIQGFEEGIVRSASLMVRWPSALEAARYSREHREFSVGLHVDLEEWSFIDGNWVQLYEVVSAKDADATGLEIANQLARFRELVGTDPTHVDSHQHVHRSEPVRSILVEMAKHLGVPLRDCNPNIQYVGGFYGQTDNGEPLLNCISSDALTKIAAGLREGYTELGCHPAKSVDIETMYGTERLVELETLCDSRVRDLIAGMDIELCSFRDVVGVK